MREIVMDTETTGLDPLSGHRIIEIGAVELENHLPTGKTFHFLINPERDVPHEATSVHGIRTEDLLDKPKFSEIADHFLDFIQNAPLIIHNAAFDVSFLNAELHKIGYKKIDNAKVIDTLSLARKKFPMGPNSLDALCRRYGIDNSKREKHGALLDSELLAAVYIELIDARQPGLSLEVQAKPQQKLELKTKSVNVRRPSKLKQRITEEDQVKHEEKIRNMKSQSLWNLYRN